MKSTQYSEKVLNHFRNPRNVGTLEGENVAVGRVGNPVCGDLMEIYIKVEDERISDIKFKTFGCGSAIATASMVTELARGRSLDEALKITREDVAKELDGLPPVKMHCSNLAADALHDAVKAYLQTREQRKVAAEKPEKRSREIAGEKEYLDRGVYHSIADPAKLKHKRVLVLDKGDDSVKMAVELTKHTGRVIFLTSSTDVSVSSSLKAELKRSDVKTLYQSELVGIKGTNEVEKVRIHDLDEDEEYELFVDSVVIL
jgi:nitrogen fixation NifU-like protein